MNSLEFINFTLFNDKFYPYLSLFNLLPYPYLIIQQFLPHRTILADFSIKIYLILIYLPS